MDSEQTEGAVEVLALTLTLTQEDGVVVEVKVAVSSEQDITTLQALSALHHAGKDEVLAQLATDLMLTEDANEGGLTEDEIEADANAAGNDLTADPYVQEEDL